MDTDQSEVPETQNQEESMTEQREKVEAMVAPTEPENPPAAVEETDQLAVNGHAAEVESTQVAEEPAVAGNMTQENKDVVEGDVKKTEEEPVPHTAESAESSEKVPAVGLEPKPASTEQPAPENIPEKPAESEPEKPAESEPEKPAESVPEPEKPAESVPEPVKPAESVPEPVKPAESVPEPVKPAESVPEPVKPAESVPEPVKPAESVPEPVVEKQVETQALRQETEPEQTKTENEMPSTVEVKSEKEAVTETVVVTKASPEKSSEAVTAEKEPSGGGAEDNPKEANLDKSESVNPEESPKEGEEAEPQKEEDQTPAPNSLSFPLLEHDQTKDAVRISRTLIVLRGLPGSGKSFLARAIAEMYKDQCSALCADDYSIKPEKPSAEGYKALDDAIVARCSEGATSPLLIVVDDTNHTHDRLARMAEIAEEHTLTALYLEPQTEWSRDPSQLKKKSKRGLEEAHLEGMKGPLEETTIPLFFGWFLLSPVQVKVGCSSMDFLKTLDTLEAFKKNTADFTGQAEKEVDLEQYFEAKGSFHCTTKFCNYGKADGATEYAGNPVVKKSYGSVSELSLTALFVTPRTFGARVCLTEEQLQLWPADTEKESEASIPGSASLPAGSRAHITLGCAEGVEPVQTGLDLLQILTLPEGEVVEEMELGSLRYYGEGRWMLSLREPICAAACFSSYYGRKEVEPPKKEPEKKKKQKCAIL
uniref:2',3'-cyclic-nucleotide 3'-phosphodiesterase n=1 Tax=Cyprinodon variegatus TaxID=28743 RepID=A0A3Q2DYE9_CYPVA